MPKHVKKAPRKKKKTFLQRALAPIKPNEGLKTNRNTRKLLGQVSKPQMKTLPKPTKPEKVKFR